MYHGRVQPLPQAVLQYIRKHALLKAGDRVGVAVSGGADSVGLLRLLLDLRSEIGVVLSVVHFNHRLRATDSDDDERFVAELSQCHKLELHAASGDVPACAAEKHLSLETAAREMRYEYFRRIIVEGRLNRIATAHTLDDQAETVLLRIVRGAGSRGLAAIYPQLSVVGSQSSNGSPESGVGSYPASIIRPLLGTRRKDLEVYLRGLSQGWREDKSNRDLRHTRNRVRHGILPRLERSLNPAVREILAETAEIARAEEEFWEKEVARVLPALWRDASRTLNVAHLATLPLALQRRLIRAAAESLGLRLEFRHVEEILGLTSQGSAAAKSAMLPNGWAVLSHETDLQFNCASRVAPPSDYEYRLPVPGRVDVPEVKSRFESVLVSGKAAEGYNPEHLLERTRLGNELRVRNWRPGDRFWPAHTKAPKKIKEMLQERHSSGPERKLWPVVVDGEAVVWVRGFPTPASLQPQSLVREAILIRELPLTD